MRILHVLAQLPHRTGSGVYFSNLIKGLAPYGHDQHAVFALQDNETFGLLPPEKQHPVRFKTEALPFPMPGMSDIMPYDSTTYARMGAERMAQWQNAFSETLNSVAAVFEPQVLVLHHLWILTSMAVDCFPQAKTVGICHHTDLRQAELNPQMAADYVRNIGRLGRVFALSDAHQQEISRVYPCDESRMVTVGCGFDSGLFAPPPPKAPTQTVKLLYAGKIDSSKGVFALLEAFGALRRAGQDIALTIVGTPTAEHKHRLEACAARDGVRLIPAVPQEQLARLMREHDVFVLPSFYEGVALIAVEALASGMWTVVTEIEALRALLGDSVNSSGAIEYVPFAQMRCGYIPEGEALARFTTLLKEKMVLQAERARFGGPPPAVIQEVQKHSWSGVAANIHQILTTL